MQYKSKGFVPLPRADADPVSARAAADLALALERSKCRCRGLVVLRHGKVVAADFRVPYRPEDKVWVYSISKSFVATAVGLAVDGGLLSLDDKAVSFFPDKAPVAVSEKLAALRVRDLLTMTSGHGKDTTTALLSAADGDWVRAFLNQPLQYDPGSHFLYNSGASFMLSAIVQTVTGETVLDYLAPRFFAPLGFDDVFWDESPGGINSGGWGIMVRLEDLAKLGQLYLNKGLWNGARILSEDWVAQATGYQVDNAKSGNKSADWLQGYGFHFWRCQHDAFRADGAAGQYCVVLPKQDAVVAIMSETLHMQPTMDQIWDILLPGFDTVDAAPGATAELRYKLVANAQGFTEMRLAFTGGALALTLAGAEKSCGLAAGREHWLDGDSTLPYGVFSVIPPCAFADEPRKVAAYYHWKSPQRLEIQWRYRESPHRDKLSIRFTKTGARLIQRPGPAGLYTGQRTARLAGAAVDHETASTAQSAAE